MANNDMNISKKFTADVNRAKDGIKSLGDELKSVYEKQTDTMKATARSTAEEKKQIKVQQSAAKAVAAHTKEVEKLRNGLDKLLASIDPTTKGLGRLDKLESKLHQSKKSGVIDDDTFDSYLGNINNQRAALSTVDSLNSGTKKLSLNTLTATSDMVSFLSQLSSGNFSAAGNSLFELINATGKLPSFFSAAKLAITAFIDVISTIKAEQERFNLALISTGNYAGATAYNLESMSKSVGSINHNYAETRDVIAELAEGGQLSADSINNIATASAYMSAVTGKSAKESIAIFNGIQDSVTNWALESNKQYHFMDLATYNRIAALEAQGKTEEAIAVATGKYSDGMQVEVEKMKKQLNWLESTWDDFKNGITDFGEGIKTELKLSLGIANLDEQISKLETEKRVGVHYSFGSTYAWNEQSEKELKAKIAEREKLNIDAQQTREKTIIQEKAISSQKELTELWKTSRTEEEKQADLIENIRKKYEALWATMDGLKLLKLKGVTSVDGKTFQGGQYDVDVTNITDQALQKYNEQLQKLTEQKQESTYLSKVMYEIDKGVYKNASDAEKKKAIELAKSADAYSAQQKEIEKSRLAAQEAASETERFIKSLESQAETQTQKTFDSRQALINAKKLTGDNLNRANAANDAITASENKKLNEDLQNQLNSLLFDPASIKSSQIDAWYQTIIAQLKANNNSVGFDLIDQILPIEKARAEIEKINQQIQATKKDQVQNEQGIQTQVLNGQITEIEKQNQLVQLHKKTATELSKYVPTLEKLAQTQGQTGKEASAILAQLKLEMAELNQTTDVLTNAFRNSLQNGIQDALQGLANRTINLNEAITNLGLSVVNAMANVASQSLAEIIMGGLDNAANLFSNLFSTSPTNLTVDTAQSAVSATESVGLIESATSLTTTLATGTIGLTGALATTLATGTVGLTGALATAFAAAATVLAAAISSASAGGTISGIAGAVSFGAATGGYLCGPGTGTSDSILMWGSNGEFMIKEASVKKYGVDFLHALNAGKLPKFATGGLVGNINIPNAPSIDNSQQQASQAVLSPVIQQELVIDAGDMLSKGINSVLGNRAMKTYIRANKQTMRQELGIKD